MAISFFFHMQLSNYADTKNGTMCDLVCHFRAALGLGSVLETSGD